MSEELQFHPYANLFPLIEGEEFEALVQDIRANGLRKRITMFEGKILDGRNRYRAARAAGYEVSHFMPTPRGGYRGDAELFSPITDKISHKAALSFVISHNLHRRHLTDAQRAAIAADIANLDNGERKSASPNGEGAVSQADAAKMLNTSKRSVERAAKRKKEDPAAHEAAKAGRKVSKTKPEPEPTAQDFAQAVVSRVGDFMTQLLKDMKNVSPEFMDQVVFKVQGYLGKFEDIYCEPEHDQERDEDDQDELEHESPDQVKTTLDQMSSAAVEMNKLTSLQHHEDGRGRPATEQILSQMKMVAGEINKLPANKDVRPTVCTDPERLKKLEQWRRQHTKSVYGSTAGGAK
jgi:ParB-like chromosome segregation protein Spo0J